MKRTVDGYGREADVLMGSVGAPSLDPNLFPFDAFEMTAQGDANPTLTLTDAWNFDVDGDVAVGGDLNVTGTISGAGLMPSGVILPFGGTSAPTGYLLCDGTSYLRASYAALFAVIGTAYGTADGTHFNVPDLRGQFIRGTDGGAAIDPDRASRTALKTGGNTGDNVGSKQTTATKLPTTAFTFTSSTQSASHTHSVTYKPTTSAGSTAVSTAQLSNTGATYTDPGATTWGNTYVMGNQSASHTHSNSTWGGGDNESRPPNVYVNFIIKT